MFTAVIHLPGAITPERIDALADTLAALVAGVAAGVVGDAVIAAAHPEDPDVATMAESTGAALVARGRNPWAAAAGSARRPWLLCLEAGDVPAEGWIRALDRFAATTNPEAVGRLRRPHAPLFERIAGRREALTGTRQIRAGDLVRAEALRAGLPLKVRLPVRPLRAALLRG
ncbi:hypothetical protein NS228_24530 [Methylobacterium indicum]|uniref:hypothetical protein n=1 Tax=Methylobacterium indicum TaxID=1775910 RepID=UPI000733DDB9|nr:hypothetical protein [Methylobacterium indicum]KTS23026.1 hypothetical protein NS229_22740 [Methylobacterium indicum]KTS30331.1 hypothetical protein NS228_24530 [Methylobacterium indicum]KTS49396.1 hypothetical protein NS230_18060 [Methylobacterium indicum]